MMVMTTPRTQKETTTTPRTQQRRTLTYDIRNPITGLRQAEKCGGIKPVNGKPTFKGYG